MFGVFAFVFLRFYVSVQMREEGWSTHPITNHSLSCTFLPVDYFVINRITFDKNAKNN